MENTKQLPFRTILRFLGPGFLVTDGFIDPGNWATNIKGGSKFGYDLPWVIGHILAHAGALACQNNAKVVPMHVIHADTIDQHRALRDKSSIAMENCLAKMSEQGGDGNPWPQLFRRHSFWQCFRKP